MINIKDVRELWLINMILVTCASRTQAMKSILLLLFALMSTGLFAQEAHVVFNEADVVFSGDHSTFRKDKQIVEFTGNAHFTSEIVEIEKADKIVYDRITKTFTISGFKELRIHGKKKLASDLGATTLKLDLGGIVAYLKADDKACPKC